MTIDEYYKFFRDLGYEPTGDGTILSEVWKHKENGNEIMFTRPDKLDEGDRIAAIGRMKMHLGIGYPKGPRVH